jgi:hypothetical protein
MAAAVVSVGVLQELVPADFRVLPRFVYPIFLLCFLDVLIIGDPGRIDRQRRWLRVTTSLMTGLITVVTAVSSVRLVVGILTNATFSSASQLLIARATARWRGFGYEASMPVERVAARRVTPRSTPTVPAIHCAARRREFSSGCLSEN